MNLFHIFSFVLLAITDPTSSKKTTLVTPVIDERVAILKGLIAEQLKNKHVTFEKSKEIVNENVEYEDRESEPITPISETDPRKKKRKYKLKQIKTTRDIGQNFKSDFIQPNDKTGKVFERISPDGKSHKRVQSKMAPVPHKMAPVPHKMAPPGRSKMVKKSKATDVFYRRYSSDHCAGWTHCQDLITPYLTGYRINITNAKRVSYDDHVVIRLLQLLTEDITDHTKDDIHSILYQISNLQLRLYQWDVAAIKLLLNVIHRDKTKRHSFKTIKLGLKSIFANWNLHFGSNIGVLMKQTRIFRPPCIKISDNEGSTKTSKTIRYTKSVKRKCSKTDADYDICMTKNN